MVNLVARDETAEQWVQKGVGVLLGAAWAPGLKQALSEFVDAILQRSSESQDVVARAVVNQSFRDHILAGHVPCRKECYSCVAGRSR